MEGFYLQGRLKYHKYYYFMPRALFELEVLKSNQKDEFFKEYKNRHVIPTILCNTYYICTYKIKLDAKEIFWIGKQSRLKLRKYEKGKNLRFFERQSYCILSTTCNLKYNKKPDVQEKVFSNFSCMFLNPNNFSQFEF